MFVAYTLHEYHQASYIEDVVCFGEQMTLLVHNYTYTSCPSMLEMPVCTSCNLALMNSLELYFNKILYVPKEGKLSQLMVDN